MATTGRGRPDNRSVRRGSTGPVQSAAAATTAAITGTATSNCRRATAAAAVSTAATPAPTSAGTTVRTATWASAAAVPAATAAASSDAAPGGPGRAAQPAAAASGTAQRAGTRAAAREVGGSSVPAVRAPAEQRRPDDRRQRCGTRERDGRPGVAGGSRAGQQQGADGHGDGRHDQRPPTRPTGLGGGRGERRQRVDGIVEHRRRRRRGRRAEPQQLPVENADVVQRGARRRRATGRPGEAPRHRPGRVALLAEQLHQHRHQVGDRDVDRQGDVGAAAGGEHGQPAVDGRGAHGTS